MKRVAALLLMLGFSAHAQFLGMWDNIVVVPTDLPPMDLQDVAYGQGKFVVACKRGSLAVGTSTGPFTVAKLTQDEEFAGVAYGNGIFVAVGDFGTVATSSNAVDWHVRRAPDGEHLRDVCFGDGQFVIVGDDGTLLTTLGTPDSPLQPQVTPLTELIWTVAFGSGIYVALAYNHTLLSSNAIDWVSIPNTHGHDSLAYGNGLFVASGGIGGMAATSNGVTWSGIGTGFEDGNVGFAGARFWGLSDGSGIFMQRPTSWQFTEPTTSEFYAVAYGDGVFVVVGEEGNILRSRDMRPKMTITKLGGSAYELRIKDGEGAQYQLQTTADLTGLSWTSNAVFTHRGWSYETALTNISTAPHRFYRLQVR